MTRKIAFDWGGGICNCEFTPHSIWAIAKSLLNRGGPRTPTAIHGPLGLQFLLLGKANAIVDCLENQFTLHDLCDENHKWRVEASVQTQLEAVDKTSLNVYDHVTYRN
jgi:hypothetical protein